MAVVYRGLWDASTNTPFLYNGVGTKGDVWTIHVGGTADLGTGPALYEEDNILVYIVSNIYVQVGALIELPVSDYMDVPGGGGGGGGTVTSVGLVLPTIFTVYGSPVTGSGNLTGSLTTQPATYFFAGPTSGSPAVPSFRPLALTDMPAGLGAGTVTQVDTTSGQLTGGPITSTGTISLATTAVSPGSYTNTNLTVDAFGRITAATNGTGGGVTSVSGTSNRITSTGGTTPVIDISASYVGQSSITTLGTITTGTWAGTTIVSAHIGSLTGGQVGISGLSATGSASSSTYLRGDNTWAAFTTGTVTSIATTGGITGGTITTTGTLSLASISGFSVLANTTGSPAAPTFALGYTDTTYPGNLVMWNGSSQLTAAAFVTDSGTSAQFVKGDGSLDGSTYLTTISGISAGGDLTGTYVNPTIGTNKVTYAKMQQASAHTILSNPTGSTANIQEITLGAGLSFSGSTLVATGAVSSVSNVDGTLTISPTTGAVVASISASYPGQSSIVTVGTITSGVWNGTALTSAYVGSLTGGQVGISGLSATGTPSSSTYLRGDNTWSTVSASPGGSSTDVQYNNSGAFAGNSGFTYDGTNVTANNIIQGLTSTATAAGTTTLTNASTYEQDFTGTTTQTVVLPVVSTLSVGFPFLIVNYSTGVVTVQSSGGNIVQAVQSGGALIVKCILTSGTTAASWDIQYAPPYMSANVDSTIVYRDTSGNFAAANITATSFITAGGTSTEYVMGDGSLNTTIFGGTY